MRDAPACCTLRGTFAACAALWLVGCATVPAGPSVPALQGSRMTRDQFAADDGQCQGIATAQVGGLSPADAANQSTAASAAAGTAIGAVTGALIDGSSGAAAGAGMGLLFGALAGTSAAQGTYTATQQQFDQAYYGCMYARGHKVPVPAHHAARYRALQGQAPAPLPARAAPPPPPADLVPPDYRPPPATPPPR